MSVAGGVFKVRVLSVTPSKDFVMSGDNRNEVKLQLRLGDQISDLESKGPEFSWKNVVLFKHSVEEKLILRLFATPDDPKIGYA